MVAMKLMSIPKELCEKHYECHKEKPFYGELVKFMTSDFSISNGIRR